MAKMKVPTKPIVSTRYEHNTFRRTIDVKGKKETLVFGPGEFIELSESQLDGVHAEIGGPLILCEEFDGKEKGKRYRFSPDLTQDAVVAYLEQELDKAEKADKAVEKWQAEFASARGTQREKELLAKGDPPRPYLPRLKSWHTKAMKQLADKQDAESASKK